MDFDRAALQETAKTKEQEKVWKFGERQIDELQKKLDAGDTLRKTMLIIMDNPCQYTANADTGEVRTMNGLNELKGLFGATSNQADAPMAGKPFSELGRQPGDHFLMYCISTGVPKEKLMELASGYRSKQLLDTLNEKHREFLELIMDENVDRRLNRCAEMYKNYLDRYPEFVNAIYDSCKQDKFAEGAVYASILGNTHSYLNQTLNLGEQGNEAASEEQKKLVALVNEKTKDSPNTLDQVSSDMKGLSGYQRIASILSLASLDDGIDEKITQQKQIYGYLQVLKEHSQFMTRPTWGLDNHVTEDRLVYYEKTASKTRDPLERHAKDVLKSLQVELSNNKRINVFGNVKENSKEYKAVQKALEDYNSGSAGLTPLKEACKTYLDSKTPSEPKGQERYVLIQQIYDSANAQDRYNKYERIHNGQAEFEHFMDLQMNVQQDYFDSEEVKNLIADAQTVIEEKFKKYLCPVNNKGEIQKDTLDERLKELVEMQYNIVKAAGKNLNTIKDKLQELNPDDPADLRELKARKIAGETSNTSNMMSQYNYMTQAYSNLTNTYPRVGKEQLESYIRDKLNELQYAYIDKLPEAEKALVQDGKNALNPKRVKKPFTEAELEYMNHLKEENKQLGRQKAAGLIQANKEEFAAMHALAPKVDHSRELIEMKNELIDLHDKNHTDSKSYQNLAAALGNFYKAISGSDSSDPKVKMAKSKLADAAIIYMQGHWTKRQNSFGANRFDFAKRILEHADPEKGERVKEYIKAKGEKRSSVSMDKLKDISTGKRVARHVHQPKAPQHNGPIA